MSGDLSGIEKLKNDYPFLKEIWETYTFEEDPKDISNNIQLFSICEENSIYGNKPTDIQIKACRKLLKNWHLLRSISRRPDNQSEWCNNINNWIYYEINPYILNDKNIHSILGKAQLIFRYMPNEQYCPFNDLNVNHDPKELNKLRIFNENTSAFNNILKKKSSDNYCSCINFVKDCINIYKNIKTKHCSTTIGIYDKRTCDIVRNFNVYYTGYLNRDIRTQENLPDLSSIPDKNINIEECKSQLKARELGSALSTTPTETAEKTVPTAIGTIAGVSSVLALLYKFSPVGTWMHSGLRGNGKMIHTNLYADGERELLTDGPLRENLNSYNIGYELA
ncbi:PIR protein [Plasmodium vivax]|uniref:VIR protein n=1 Tax=Plasmodium vivax TaxID=5855 RepID=A0A564ZXT4_PLAVI|nr:PIR protein [Plasmodium vivax]